MPSGSCFCGKSTLTYERDSAVKVRCISPPSNSRLYLLSFSSWSPNPPRPRPPKRAASSDEPKPSTDQPSPALCNCEDCQKMISGGACSVNIVVPESGFRARGPLRETSRCAEGRNSIVSHLCAECGNILYRDTVSFPGLKVIKAGVLEKRNSIDAARPASDLYSQLRVDWAPDISGAPQKEGMQQE